MGESCVSVFEIMEKLKEKNQKPKISVVVTTLNEAETIVELLESLAGQTLSPIEVVVVDGGSVDKTAWRVQEFIKKDRDSGSLHFGGQAGSGMTKTRIFSKNGNRSVGRNYGVEKASGDLIAFTDAGCRPDLAWLKELELAMQRSRNKSGMTTKHIVVAGYYYGLPATPFEEAVVPYSLVMPERVNPKTFLPSTRSMLISKKLFLELGGFDEKLSDNEDFALARKIKSQKSKVKIILAKKARVGWYPRKNLREFVMMIYRFARGDARARILRPKVSLIYLRYLFLIIFSCLYLASQCKMQNAQCQNWNLIIWYLLGIWILLFGIYSLWSIRKNYRYVKNGWYYLPVLQIASDLAVMIGTIRGLLF